MGEAVDTHGAWAMILIRAPPTMTCGDIRRVVLENEKNKFKKLCMKLNLETVLIRELLINIEEQ